VIHRTGFDIGQKVKFQDSNFVWREGEVVDIKWRRLNIVGAGGTVTEASPTKLTIAYRDSLSRKWRETEMPVKRVKLVEKTA
jgi:hypothetical protein